MHPFLNSDIILYIKIPFSFNFINFNSLAKTDFLPTFIQSPVTYLPKFKVLAIITKVKQIEVYLEENRA